MTWKPADKNQSEQTWKMTIGSHHVKGPCTMEIDGQKIEVTSCTYTIDNQKDPQQPHSIAEAQALIKSITRGEPAE